MRLTLALLLALLVASCAPTDQGGPGAALRTTREDVVWPLRGTSAPDREAVRRRPLVVKVDANPAARPQTGFADADLVIEIPVEGGLTRFALVFHSQDPASVGPVRSARQSDLNYIASLHAILAHVGASEAVTKQVRDAARSGAFLDVDQFDHPDAFERTSDRVAPHNVYTSGAKLRSAAGAAGGERVTVPSLRFGAAPAGGSAVASLTVPYGEAVRYEYDSSRGGYRRTYDGGQKTLDAKSGEVLPENVVIVVTDVREIAGTADAAGTPSVDYRSTGSGTLVVLRDGMRFDGTWARQEGEMYALKDASGAPLALKPGLTWIHIVPTTFDLG